ncbi:MAG: HNH endonuclease [Cyclobacteriaceae bacterium]
MKRRVLILNQDYSPLMVCSVERAFVLVWLSKADLVTEAEGVILHTVTDEYPVPAVIRLHKYIKLPYRGVVLTRQNVFKRDKFTCQYCGDGKELTLDHVLPRSRGGRSLWTNLVTACKRCNARKGDRLPEHVNMILKTKPTKPSYMTFLRDFSGDAHAEWEPFLLRKAMV